MSCFVPRHILVLDNVIWVLYLNRDVVFHILLNPIYLLSLLFAELICARIYNLVSSVYQTEISGFIFD